MKIVGEKLKIARQIRNMTITDLASKINVSKQAVSQFEKEENEPKSETLFNIVKLLKFPLSYFTTPYNQNIKKGNTFFRSLKSTTALAKNHYIEKTKMLLVIYDFLMNYLDMPELDLPKINLATSNIDNAVEEYDYDLIAEEVRKQWHLGNRAIWNMVDLLEQHGIIMSVLKDESSKIDAFTFTEIKDNKIRYCIMLENEKNSMARRNFSIAHELGHIILHSHLNLDELDSCEDSLLERQANMFAASFLLPKNDFINDLKRPKDFDAYVYLKSKWHVSIKAMFNRAKELKLLSQNEYISLLKKYNYYLSKYNQNGERMEPLDDQIAIDKPELFETALKVLFDAKVFKNYIEFSEKLSQIGCGVEKEMLYDIMSLTDNFFDKYKSEPIILNLKNN